MDTLECMRVFAGVVEEGSFSGAAKKLGISNALTSKYIAQLEDKLGARLFNRTTRSVSPTEIGSAYYPRCLDVLERVDDLEGTVQEHTGSARGHLRIAGPRAICEEMLTACVSDFIEKYDQITVDLVLDERKVDMIAEGFDVAIRASELKDSSLIAKRVAGFQHILCATPEYVEKYGMPLEPDDLRGHCCIVNAAISPLNRWHFNCGGSAIQINVKPKARINSVRAIRKMTLDSRGIGQCLLPTVAEDIKECRLVRVMERHERDPLSVYILYPPSRYLAPKVRAFVDHTTAWFKKG